MSTSHSEPAPAKEAGGQPRRIGDVWQRLGTSGGLFGTTGIDRRILGYGYGTAALAVGLINTLNVITEEHDLPHINPLEPVIWEGSSWFSLLAFFWIIWLAWRTAPLGVRPRWLLLIHVPAAVLYSLTHVGGFVGLRIAAYWALGGHYHVGHFWSQFFYELRKDSLGYLMFLAGLTLIARLLHRLQPMAAAGPATFDIRDGARLTRVPLADILAVSSAGNYVEFALADGRKLLMRRPLSAVENELSERGFVRTHRSWLVNEKAVTGLSPEGSGDYDVRLGSLNVPLSRRFPDALARLRAGNPS